MSALANLRNSPHDQARSRAYRWGAGGLDEIADHKAAALFAVDLWNRRGIANW
jgi:hypothetical protein